VVRTRVGYSGGTKDNPTYHSLGDHAEAIQIDYDPGVIGYSELLDLFWASHDPAFMPYSRQYASFVFYSTEEQRLLAEESRARKQAELGRRIYTEIVPFDRFFLAEDYHQKFDLRQDRSIAEHYRSIYPALSDFVDSTATTRLNGYLGGNGTRDQLLSELESLGLPEEAHKSLLERVR
jgi:methionine-S-sulfoxide reductase